jgi:alkylation response protein AidB-like acyl-CoA dehydrogenase
MAFDLPNTDGWLARAARLREAFALDAPARDRAGGAPSEQIRLLKESGLLDVIIPVEYGGAGEPYSTALKVTRELARADGSLGHLYGYHHNALIRARTQLGRDPAAAELLRRSAAGDWLWGNTSNSFSETLFGRTTGEWTTLDGFKPFCSGSHVADYLTVAWNDVETGERRFAAVPADREGIVPRHDWDGFGQTQTGSGVVDYTSVRVHESERVAAWVSDDGGAIGTLGPFYQQSVLLNVFVGSAQGALAEARDYTVAKSRPWIYSGHDRHIDDPWIQRQYGELHIRVEAATALADRAAAALDFALARGDALTAEERGALAVDIAAANALAGELALEVTEEIFEVMGARSATRHLGFDRFWRNVRIHTLHNPAHYKLRTVGTWFLTGDFPEPGLFR